MAKLRAVLFLITQNPMSAVPKWVPEYHSELIAVKFGEAASVIEEGVMEFDIPDDIEIEIARLREYYGVDPETNVGVFDMVFGRSHLGKRKFTEAFEASLAVDKPVKAKAKAKAADKSDGNAGSEAGDKPAGDTADKAAGNTGDEPDPLGN